MRTPLRAKVRALMLVLLFLAVPNRYGPAAEEVIEIGGTGAAIGCMKLLSAAFVKTAPGIKIHILPSMGSSGAIEAVSKGALSIGMISRPLKRDEFNIGIAVTAYAKTPFILVTRKNVPVLDLTTGELADIYRGAMQRWPNDELIRLVLRPETDTDTLLVRSLSPGMSSAVTSAFSRKGMLMALTDQDCADLLETTPGAVGFTSLTQVITEKRKLKILSLNGMLPGAQALAAGTYPYFKTLSLVTKADPPRPVERFIDFLFSARGRKILEDSGALPLERTSGL